MMAAAALVALAVSPPLAAWLEARLVTHILGQYPLLAGAGALVGAALARRRRMPWSAAPALLAGVLTVLFWLLPRWIDAALADPSAALAKAVSLAALAGLALGWGWAQAGPVLRGFVLANAAAMLAVMGWLQVSLPQRLCNSYLLAEQIRFGHALLALAALILAGGVTAALAGTAGGEEAKTGRNAVERTDGTVVELKHTDQIEMKPGDVFVIETPGGGGCGKKKA
jgi:hypothetical protein